MDSNLQRPDSTRQSLGSKSDTLKALEGRLEHALVLPQVSCSVSEWRRDPEAVIRSVREQSWGRSLLIVRSSAAGEDDIAVSSAGRFTSVPGVTGEGALREAITRVIASYPPSDAEHQFFIQPCLKDVTFAGVAFGRDPNSGGRYIVIDFDKQSRQVDTVTAGRQGSRTYVEFWESSHGDDEFAPIVRLVRELSVLFGTEWLDVEFALDGEGTLYLLQVRALPSRAPTNDLSTSASEGALKRIAHYVDVSTRRHPHLIGSRTVFGIMPDWNPAEIIGIRPKPLALSLYRELVTDNIWAYQRYKYGYRDVRSFPLVVDFEGLPYVDVRVSFNSFVPRDMKPSIAERLVDYYVDKLVDAPGLHDKVEFDIVFSCYTPDLPIRMQVLENHGFTPIDIGHVAEVLRRLTNRIIGRRDGLWQEDVERTRTLEQRRQTVLTSQLSDSDKLFWLLEDCKRFGTLPFAGLARCAFIATQFLQSLLTLEVFDREDYAAFMASLDTVSARMGRDLATLPFEEFLNRYGHLRPGTYDITCRRYDEAAEHYFGREQSATPVDGPREFQPSGRQQREIDALLHEHAIDYDTESLLQFIRTSIEAREDVKFSFTRSVSDALDLVARIGTEHNHDVEAMSFVTIGALRESVARTTDLSHGLEKAVAEGKERWATTQQLILPPVIVQTKDVYAFQVPTSQPNFITLLTATGPVVDVEQSAEVIDGSIVLIRSADPGWDWILTRGISAFITQYGGANSHMAVRAHQLGLPAVIGAGESLFERCRRAQRLLVDCRNHQITVLS